MSSVSIDQQIADIIKTIGREYGPQKIILFGSYVRGEMTIEKLTPTSFSFTSTRRLKSTLRDS